MSDDIIPRLYEQWRNCIEVRCKIRLTPTYIHERLTELQDGKHAKTKEFAKLYGADYLQQTIAWFRRAADDMTENRK